ncbi:alpha/beta hydrolase [Campylobacter concisus]|uniref:alpha/beta hydrolase n=2 Tax=Campylobacter TaxID=194 RepID=UPI001C5AA1A0|nr:alpha/beta hydrolase [Campylobacter concisus]
MKKRDFMKISVGGAVAMSSLNAKENNAGERVEKLKVPFANPSKEAAANAAKNPFGLVYGDAISKNEEGKVNLTPVSYKSRGLDIAANVYTPANFDPNKSYAAIVVAHPNGGVKEQVAGLYAQRLAELGYVAIAFDAAYQGASGGMPRNVDTPANRIEDIRAAADFLLKFKGVDRDRIGVLGICGGGGYTLKAAQTDKIFKAVATLSAFDSGLARRNGFLDA